MKQLPTVLCLTATLVGCSQAQLTGNTIEVSTTVDILYTKQVLDNLSKYIDEPYAIPGQSDVQTGTILTSNTVTPSVGFPLSQAITNTRAAAAALTVTHGTSLAAVSGNISAGQQWQQSWNLVPLTDANILRNLRALYRYVIYDTDLTSEYQVPRLTNGKPDPEWLREPQCVLCGARQQVNPLLQRGWLYWTSEISQITDRPPPSDVSVVDLGRFGTHNLFMTALDFKSGKLANFTLFVMPNSSPTQTGKGAAGSPPGSQPGRAPAPANRPPVGPPPYPPPVPAPSQ
jgi:hypothetical protein